VSLLLTIFAILALFSENIEKMVLRYSWDDEKGGAMNIIDLGEWVHVGPFDRLGHETPTLCPLMPASSITVPNLDRARGVPAVAEIRLEAPPEMRLAREIYGGMIASKIQMPGFSRP
jgi:hypothetical protein